MTLTHKDRVKETSTTTGTGAYTLLGAVTGFQAFSAIGDGNTCYYTATDGTNWETGIGTYASSGTTLTRTTILASSNAGSAVSWSAGSRTIFCDIPASKFIGRDDTGVIFGTTLIASGSLSGGSVTISSIPATYRTWVLAVIGAQISTNTLTVEYSVDNGSTWKTASGDYIIGSSSATSLWAITSAGGSNVYSIFVTIVGLVGARGTPFWSLGRRTSGAGADSGSNLGTGVALNTSQINALRIKVSAGSFAAGTYDLTGYT